MKKEEILSANKEDNKKKDVYEMEVDAKGCRLASMVMFCLAFILLIYEMAVNDVINPAFYSFLAIFNAVAYGYKACKLEKDRKLNLFISISWGIVTIALLLVYFKVI